LPRGRLTARIDGLAARLRALPRGRPVLAATVVAALLLAGGIGMFRTYDYVQHDNEFCVSCHLMQVPYERFSASKHRDLSCKACHKPTNLQRGKMALTQLAEWPDEIKAHASVPNERCKHCHVEGDPEQWRQIGQTAGHRAHLESRDPALANLSCVTCHSVSVHEFAPTDAVCGQSGCHETVEVRLGGMEHLAVHCVVCHDFTRAAPRGARRSLINTDGHLLVPRQDDCLHCHDMQELVDIAPANEPHGAVCGTCHDAHAQEVGKDALKSCTANGCHENPENYENSHHRWRSVRLADCTRCHTAHDFKVDENDCARCHASVFRRTGTEPTPAPPSAIRNLDAGGWAGATHGPAPSMPIEGVRALLATGLLFGATAPGGLQRGAAAQEPQQQRTFDHARHRTVACRQCHTSAQAVPALNPAWCEGCHHGDPNPARCARCHSSALLAPRMVEFPLHLPGGPSQRTLTFQHAPHQRLDCARCHGAPPRRITRAICGDCHAEHHGGEAACANCHAKPPAWAHEPAVVHTSCGRGGAVCHTRVGDGIEPERRPVCLACHPEFPREGPLPAMPRRVDNPPGGTIPVGRSGPPSARRPG